MKTTIHSIFSSHYNDFMNCSSAEELSEKVQQVVTNSKINVMDKRKILFDLSQIKDNLQKIQMYLTNSMLKYQGLGIRKSYT